MMDSIEALKKTNAAIFNLRYDEFVKVLEQAKNENLLEGDQHWILRYSLLTAPDCRFYEKALQLCIDNNTVLFDWMLSGPKYSL